MTAAEFELLDESEAHAILGWRFRALSEAGYELAEALTLTTATDVDLHLACDLIRRGCPPETAVRILL
jgi:hypothetical protein